MVSIDGVLGELGQNDDDNDNDNDYDESKSQSKRKESYWKYQLLKQLVKKRVSDGDAYVAHDQRQTEISMYNKYNKKQYLWCRSITKLAE